MHALPYCRESGVFETYYTDNIIEPFRRDLKSKAVDAECEIGGGAAPVMEPNNLESTRYRRQPQTWTLRIGINGSSQTRSEDNPSEIEAAKAKEAAKCCAAIWTEIHALQQLDCCEKIDLSEKVNIGHTTFALSRKTSKKGTKKRKKQDC